MTAAELAQRVRAKRRGEWYDARCPTHDDSRPSLSFRDGDLGVIFYCRRGCPSKDVATAMAKAIGVSVSAFYGDGEAQIVKTYDYTDANGNLVLQEVRLEPKGFFVQRPDGNGGWIKDAKGVPPCLYRFQDIHGQTVVAVTEGPKDAERLWAIGIPATTNPFGAGKWTDDHATLLVAAGVKEVLVFRDNDEPGEAHALRVAESCLRAGLIVKHIYLPGLPARHEKHGEDVTDWLHLGHAREELEAVINGASPIEPVEIHDPRLKSVPGTVAPLVVPEAGMIGVAKEFADLTVTGSFRLTDLGNAERLVARYGAHIRYVPQWGWLVWDGRRWGVDEGECEVRRLAAQTTRQIYAEAASVEDKEERKALVKHAHHSEARPRLEAMVKLAEPKVAAKPSDFDRNPWLLNVETGTIDLKTGQLGPHRSENFITRLAPVRYDPQASAPTWGRFLDEVFERREALIRFLQKAVGYSLTGLTDEQVLFILYGVGANGKTTLLRALRAMLGDYALQTPAETLLVKRDGHIPNDLARLKGARLVTAVETEDGRRVAEVLVKQMTGGDPITARFLHREFFEFVPEFKLFVAANHKPRIRGTDHAIWRRVRLVPFNVVFDKPDRTLPNRLLAEVPGILAWAVEGCRLWQAEGLGLPEEVRVATDTYRQEQDVVGQFIEERCVAAPTAQVKFGDLYDDYATWCQRTGEEPLSKKVLGARLGEKGFTPLKRRGDRIWRGLGLVVPGQRGDDGDDRDERSGFLSESTPVGGKPVESSSSSPSSPGTGDAEWEEGVL